jgi:hypothetical protein
MKNRAHDIFVAAVAFRKECMLAGVDPVLTVSLTSDEFLKLQGVFIQDDADFAVLPDGDPMRMQMAGVVFSPTKQAA